MTFTALNTGDNIVKPECGALHERAAVNDELLDGDESFSAQSRVSWSQTALSLVAEVANLIIQCVFHCEEVGGARGGNGPGARSASKRGRCRRGNVSCGFGSGGVQGKERPRRRYSRQRKGAARDAALFSVTFLLPKRQPSSSLRSSSSPLSWEWESSSPSSLSGVGAERRRRRLRRASRFRLRAGLRRTR